jgi:hypothetical protein
MQKKSRFFGSFSLAREKRARTFLKASFSAREQRARSFWFLYSN